MTMLTDAWQDVELLWSSPASRRAGGYAALRRTLETFLVDHGIRPAGFSHYGIVVRDVDAALERLCKARRGAEWKPARRDRVDSFQVTVARGELDSIELEYIEPYGESFFASFLETDGEGLHHISFRVTDLEECFQRLVGRGSRFVDDAIRLGSHGSIAFVMPHKEGPPACLELCQPRGNESQHAH